MPRNTRFLVAAIALVTGCKGADAPRVAHLIEIVTGNEQTATVRAAVSVVPTVIVRDQNGNAMGSAALIVTVGTGGGTITGAPTATLASGATPVGTWTLGPLPGANILTITSGAATSSILATAVAGTPTKVVLKSGFQGLSGIVGFTIGTNIVVQLLDEFDNPVAGATPVVTASHGGSTAFASPVSDAAGNIAISRWTLGTLAGTQTLSISAGTGTPVTVSATARAGNAAQIVPAINLPLTAFAGAPTSTPLAVRVTDSFGNVVSGALVTFGVLSGGGSISGGSQVATNANGIATGGTWTLGATFFPQLAIASIPGTAATMGGQVVTGFRGTLRFAGTVDAPIQAGVQAAFDRLRMAVVGPLDDQPVVGFDAAAQCGLAAGPILNETVRDVLIFLQVGVDDGAGGRMARSVPCLTRGNTLPIVHAITLDVADTQFALDNNLMDALVLRELIHALGFGNAWAFAGLISGAGTADPRFLGANATAAFAVAGGTSAPGVPIENVGGAGVLEMHWRSTSFGAEAMTGTIAVGQVRPLSAITLQSLVDLGWAVNPFVAEPFQFAGPAIRRR